MTYEPFLIVGAGVVAGGISSAVGSGTLLLYPALLGAGLTPVSANATNSLGLLPGNLTGAWRYRTQLVGQTRSRLVRWVLATATGALIGAALVVFLPPAVFAAVIPWLILAAVTAFALEPLYMARLQARRDPGGVTPAIGAVGLWGGYFGGGQGMAYLLVLTALDGQGLQSANAVKNQMMAAANGVAAVVFLCFGDITWWAAACAAAGSVLGGWGGAGIASRLPVWLLRAVIVLAGLLGFVVALRA
jgi:uncharacterized membrane protein YfcA